MTMTTVAVILLFIFTVAHGFQTKPVNSSSGLYFEETGKLFFYTDEWKIVTNVNLTKYHNEFDAIRNTVTAITNNCEELKQIKMENNISIEGNEGCGIALVELSALMADIEENDNNWFGKPARVKRHVLADMVLDDWPNDNFSFVNEFVNMTASGSETSTSVDERTSYMMSTLNLAGRLSVNSRASINNNVAHQLAHIRDTLAAARNGSFNAVRWFQLRTTTRETISSQLSILRAFASKQKQYSSILSLVGMKKVQVRTIMSPIVLFSELSNIRNIVSEKGLGFPIQVTSENIPFLFELSSAEVSIFKAQIFVTIKLPLIAKQPGNFFTLFKVTSSLYSLIDNIYTFVVPNHEFIAVDARKEKYITLTVDALNNCRQMSNDEVSIICQQISPSLPTLAASDCEVNILLRAEHPSNCQRRYIVSNAGIFIKVLQPNSWLVTMPTQTKIRYMCEGKAIEMHFSQINGLLTIGSNCKFVTGNVVLIGRNTFAKSSIREHQIRNVSLEQQKEKCSGYLSDNKFSSNNIIQVVSFGEAEKLLRINDNDLYKIVKFRECSEGVVSAQVFIVILAVAIFLVILFFVLYAFYLDDKAMKASTTS